MSHAQSLTEIRPNTEVNFVNGSLIALPVLAKDFPGFVSSTETLSADGLELTTTVVWETAEHAAAFTQAKREHAEQMEKIAQYKIENGIETA